MVSVIMPFYNAPLELTARAFESVVSQEIGEIEIVVVDDGSSPESARGLEALVRRFAAKIPIRLLRQENAGPAVARNRAVSEARYDILAQLDADDRWLPGKLARQVRYLQEHPDVWMVFGGMVVESETGERLKYRGGHRRVQVFEQSPQFQYLALLENNYVNNSTACFRREGFESLGGYDARFPPSEDADLWIRACRAGLVIRYLDIPMAVQVYHGGNISHRQEARRKAWLGILRRELGSPPGFLAHLPPHEVTRVHAAAWFRLGRYANHAGETALACKAFARALRLRPGIKPALRWLGASARRMLGG